MTGDPGGWPLHTCNQPYWSVVPPPPCPACQFMAAGNTAFPSAPFTGFNASFRLTDDEIERIAKRVVELLQQTTDSPGCVSSCDPYDTVGRG